MKKLKDFELSTKIAIWLAFSLLIIFTLYLGISTLILRNMFNTKTENELFTLAESNAQAAQNIIDTALLTNADAGDYVVSKYSELQSSTVEPTYKSHAYANYLFTLPQYITEDYLVSSFTSAIQNNDSILGMAALFSPNAFSNYKDYAIFISKSTIDSGNADIAFTTDYSQADYYSVAMETGEIYITEPYISTENAGKVIVSVCTPIIYEGKSIGVIVSDIATTMFNSSSEHAANYDTKFSAVFSEAGSYITSDFSDDFIGKSYFDEINNQNQLSELQSNLANKDSFTMSIGDTVDFYYPLTLDNITWWSVTGLKESDMNSDAINMTFILLGLSVISMIAILFVSVLVVKKYLTPLRSLNSMASDIASGKFSGMATVHSNDEIGQLQHNFNDMSSTLASIISEIEELLYEMSHGNFDLTVSNSDLYVGSLNNIRLSFDKIMEQISKTMSNIKNAAQQVSIGAEQVAYASHDLAQGTSQQAQSVSELLDTVSDLSSYIDKTASDGTNAKEISSTVMNEIAHNNTQMQELMCSMQDIEHKSNEINKIIKTIEDIAFQTNILALNAAVEAARAGESGRGFAVVADEVRNLANKSSVAAQDTAKLILASMEPIHTGVELAKQAADNMQHTAENAKITTSIISNIALSTDEQASAVALIKQNVSTISAVTHANASAGQESAATSEELSQQASTLTELVATFKLHQ